MENNAIAIGKVRITSGFFLLLAALCFFNEKLCLEAAIAVAFHELGHAAALKLMGAKIGEIRFSGVGLSMSWQFGSVGYPGEIIAIAAGPLMSFAIAYICSALGAKFYEIAGISLIYGIFNLIPVSGLDGGGIVFSIAAMCGGIETAEKVSKALDLIILALMVPTGVFVLLKTHNNFTLLIAALWLALNSRKSPAIKYY
jgi:Zn-dependent protease